MDAPRMSSGYGADARPSTLKLHWTPDGEGRRSPRHRPFDLIRHRERGIRVGEVMSTPAVTIESTATVRVAARRMSQEHLHRLVAVDEHGRPSGVISAMDFVALAAEG